MRERLQDGIDWLSAGIRKKGAGMSSKTSLIDFAAILISYTHRVALISCVINIKGLDTSTDGSRQG